MYLASRYNKQYGHRSDCFHDLFGLSRENLSSWVCEQHWPRPAAHSRRLISAFVIRFLESIIPKLVTGEISIFYLVSVAEETGLKPPLSDTTKTGFLSTRPIWT